MSKVNGSTKALLIAIFLLALSPQKASAHFMQADSTRYFNMTCAGFTVNQHWHHGAVPVYLNTSLNYGIQYLLTPSGQQWGLSDFSAQLLMVLNEFNSNVGANIRLYYAGTTSSVTVSGAIVIHASQSPSSNLGYGSPDGSCAQGFYGQIVSARIGLYRFTQSGASRTFHGFEPAAMAGVSLRALLNHEIGHVLGLNHSNLATLYDSGGQVYQASPFIVMNFSTSTNALHWSRYDKDTLRNAYFQRPVSYRTFYSGAGRGWGSSWRSWGYQLSQVLTGGGRATELASGKMIFGYVASQSPPIKGISWSNPASFHSQFSAPLQYQSLTAPAFAYGNGQFRSYWLEADQPVGLQNGNTAAYGTSVAGNPFVNKRIHWMSSPDGINWTYQGIITDPSNGTQIRIWTDDVSVGFDANRQVFAVTWIDGQYNGRLLTMPAPGSSQLTNVYSLLPARYWETPVLSCGGTSIGCQLVGLLHVPPIGSSIGVPYIQTHHGFFQADGTFAVTGASSSVNIRTAQVASVVRTGWDNGWILVYIGVDGGSLYASKKFGTGTSWPVPAGPILGSPYALSPPSLGTWDSSFGFGHIGLAVASYEP